MADTGLPDPGDPGNEGKPDNAGRVDERGVVGGASVGGGGPCFTMSLSGAVERGVVGGASCGGGGPCFTMSPSPRAGGRGVVGGLLRGLSALPVAGVAGKTGSLRWRAGSTAPSSGKKIVGELIELAGIANRLDSTMTLWRAPCIVDAPDDAILLVCAICEADSEGSCVCLGGDERSLGFGRRLSFSGVSRLSALPAPVAFKAIGVEPLFDDGLFFNSSEESVRCNEM